ncbi:alpha/beta fold hydrolase [Agrococcus carbonis]|uniref:Pimeloyl-ACP methyl ester carboxylesterase n=1 Tax=Agrococcus carbonis TaxID=684552 RepID=A0A1H1Q820_9MICO|nr:alpha/beta fold hydrolase [Agrococcus carbonis]SDS19473.1 Pimeloyl-ACP methyl ester carboxylesterase [Agrococcus carbonis]
MSTISIPSMPHIDGIAHRRIRVGDLEVHVAEAGPASATPVLLLHGSPVHWLEQAGVMRELAGDHRAIAPDARGLGWTTGPADRITEASLVADALGLLDALGIDRVHLVAQDFSMFAGWRLAFDHADRIASLVALQSPHPWMRPTAAMLRQAWRLWFQPVIAAPGLGPLVLRSGRQRLMRHLLRYGGHEVTGVALASFLERMRQPDVARGLSTAYRQLILPGMAALPRGPFDGRHLAVPTRILVGLDDPVLRIDGMGPWRGTAGDLEVRPVERAAHFVALERPDAVAAAVRELSAAAPTGA